MLVNGLPSLPEALQGTAHIATVFTIMQYHTHVHITSRLARNKMTSMSTAAFP